MSYSDELACENKGKQAKRASKKLPPSGSLHRLPAEGVARIKRGFSPPQKMWIKDGASHFK